MRIERYRVRHIVEEFVCWCGYPVFVGDDAYEYCEHGFCSGQCAGDWAGAMRHAETTQEEPEGVKLWHGN